MMPKSEFADLFPRIGWKDFEIDVPGGRVDLLSSDGHPWQCPSPYWLLSGGFWKR